MSEFYSLSLGTVALAAVIGILGAIYGSFCGKMSYRLAGHRFSGLSVFGASFCPQCGKRLQMRDKIPVISYFRLGRKCRRCGNPISKRYLLFEIAGIILPFVFLWFNNLSVLSFINYMVAMALLTDFFICLDTGDLSYLLSFFIILILLIYRAFDFESLGSFFVGTLCGFFVGALIVLVFKEKKKAYEYLFFSASLGFFLGFPLILMAAILTAILSLIYLLVRTLSEWHKRKIPPGCFLILSGFISLFFASNLITFYYQALEFIF